MSSFAVKAVVDENGYVDMVCYADSKRDDDWFKAQKMHMDDLVMHSLIYGSIPHKTLRLKGISVASFKKNREEFIKDNPRWMNSNLPDMKKALGLTGKIV